MEFTTKTNEKIIMEDDDAASISTESTIEDETIKMVTFVLRMPQQEWQSKDFQFELEQLIDKYLETSKTANLLHSFVQTSSNSQVSHQDELAADQNKYWNAKFLANTLPYECLEEGTVSDMGADARAKGLIP